MSVQRIDRNSVKQILDGYVQEQHSVVIKFYGTNCGYCHNLAPLYKKISDDYEDVLFYAFNMDDGQGFEDKYDFNGVPTICHVKTAGHKTRVSFLSEPDEPDGGEEGTWYHHQDLIDFIEQNRQE